MSKHLYKTSAVALTGLFAFIVSGPIAVVAQEKAVASSPSTQLIEPAVDTAAAEFVTINVKDANIAEVLKAKGYATGIVGKWHLGDQRAFLPTRQGFDSWFGLPYSNDMGPVEDGIKSNLGDPLRKAKPGRKQQPPLPLMRNETVLKRVLPDTHQALVELYTDMARRLAGILEDSGD